VIHEGYTAEVDPYGMNMNPDDVLADIRALWASGSPQDFERMVELTMALDTRLQRGGSLPRDWER